jgi:hypothetical protein
MKGMKDRVGIIAMAALLLAATATMAAEEMYRWVDSNGEVHYSDQPPPPEVKEYRAITRSGAAARTSSEAQSDNGSLAEKETEFQRRRAQEAEEEARAEQAEAERRKNCELARGQYNTISAGGRISRRDAAGEVVYLTDEQIAAETAEAQAEVEKWCND